MLKIGPFILNPVLPRNHSSLPIRGPPNSIALLKCQRYPEFSDRVLSGLARYAIFAVAILFVVIDLRIVN